MTCCEHIAFSFVALSLFVILFGGAFLVILRRKSCPCNGAHRKDIISQLPDDILASIITYIPTKSAIRTSILSKRWRNLYKFASSINLCCEDLLQRYTPAPHDSSSDVIVYRLERFLRLYSGSKIHSFTLACCLNKLYTEQFIYSLGNLDIEKLRLFFSCGYRPSDLSFPCHLLSEMPSLKYLLLGSCYLQPSFKSQCNSIQTLHLVYVRVLHGSLECILSSCSRLQSLSIDHCPCPSRLCFQGPNLQLKTLTVDRCTGVEEIELYASNLITFEFQNLEMINIMFDHVPRLQTLYISLESKIIMSRVLGKLAEDLPQLKSLTFNTPGDFFHESGRVMRMGVEMFSNLRRLALSFFCAAGTNLFAIIQFLQICPLLQEFHLDAQDAEYDLAKPENPVILLPELKKVDIGGFCGTENEIEFALDILRSAVSLEEMLINCRPKYYGGLGKWERLERTPWCEETRKMIEKQLQGQTLSKTVVIRYIS